MHNAPDSPDSADKPGTPNTPGLRGSKQALTINVAGLAVSPLIYIGMTYFAPVMDRPMPPALRMGLLAAAVVATILGPVVERLMLDRAKSPPNIQTTAIISGGLAEVSALLGLVVFFMSGQRDWIFFLLSLLAYARLLLRLPEFYRLMDEKSP